VKRQGLPKPALITVVVVVLLVAAAGAYFLLVSPKKSAASDLQAEIESVQTQIAANRLAVRQAEQVEPIRVADLFRVAKAMPDTIDMPGVLLELNRVARESGIRFNSISSSADAADAGGYLRQPIELVFEGNYYELSDFLYRLRSLVSVRGGELAATGRLFSVRSLAFNEGEGGFPQIKATLNVDAFVYGTGAPGTPAAAGAAPSPAPAPAAGAPPAAPPPAPAPAPAPTGTAMGAP
jgi:hypothetical protein